MITGLLFLNQKGELIISRMYRTSFAAKTVADTFLTQVLGAKDFGRSPVKFFGGQSFMFIKHTNVYIVRAASPHHHQPPRLPRHDDHHHLHRAAPVPRGISGSRQSLPRCAGGRELSR